ncbi:DENN domain-containing protein 10 isoform X1 [Hydra vulgaris]|uniref:DENN domain-containing protein 10 isoform X1 n=1 Tax=Hydra vulgaris TaxID=6087 RepID=UPI001F5F6409|nr:DENN domain-containing protein 10 [Hydra vulgaris]
MFISLSDMAAVDLVGITIFEKDLDGEIICSWIYPSINAELKRYFIGKCNFVLSEHDQITFYYGHIQTIWYYVSVSKEDNITKKKIKDVYIFTISNSFNPEFHEALGKEFLKSYTFGMSAILNQYLSIYTKGFCTCCDLSMLTAEKFDQYKAYSQTCIKELITLFGMEIVLLYIGMLLKKRIVIYAPKLQMLLDICRSMPALTYHRLNWNIVYPHMSLNDANDINTLKKQRTYVVGFTEAGLENRNDLYDLFINVSDAEVVINPDSKEYFQMSKLHKDIATYLVQTSQDDDVGDDDIIKGLTKKTKDIIDSLKNMDSENQTNPGVSMDLLKSKNLSKAMQAFLFNLASAEGLVKIIS